MALTDISSSSAARACGRASSPLSTLTLGSEFERRGSVVLVPRNKALLEEGDPADYVFKVVAGALRTVRFLPDGRRHIANFLLPGDLFGYEDAAFHVHGVEAASDATVIRYPRQLFDDIIRRDAGVARQFLALVCGQLASTQDRLLLLGRKSATERLASFLLALAERMRGNGSQDKELDLPMSRSDIADYLGLTVETVSRTLTHLRSTHVIELPSVAHVVLRQRRTLNELSACAA